MFINIGMFIINMVLCDASISKNLANKKQKNLKLTFYNPTKPHHCKSSVNDTVYTEAFLEASLTRFLMQKFWISSI